MGKSKQPRQCYIVDTQDEVANFFELNRVVTVREWVAKGMPRTPNGRRWHYDLRKISRWHEDRAVENARNRITEAGKSRAELELRKLAVEVETGTVKLQNMADQLVDREAVKAAIRRQYTMIRNRLEAFPDEVIANTPTSFPEVRELLENACEASSVESARESIQAALLVMEKRSDRLRESIREDITRKVLLLLTQLASFAERTEP